MDKYDKQIADLLAAPDFRKAVTSDWFDSKGLFNFVGPHGCGGGCLTMVKNRFGKAYCQELTESILNDPRVPDDVSKITPESLTVFGDYQRQVDRAIGEERRW